MFSVFTDCSIIPYQTTSLTISLITTPHRHSHKYYKYVIDIELLSDIVILPHLPINHASYAIPENWGLYFQDLLFNSVYMS